MTFICDFFESDPQDLTPLERAWADFEDAQNRLEVAIEEATPQSVKDLRWIKAHLEGWDGFLSHPPLCGLVRKTLEAYA